MNFFNHTSKTSGQLFFIRGASILEILVTAGASFLIFCVIYVNFQSSGGQVSVSNLAHDVSYGIHQAQVYGLGDSNPVFFNGKAKSFGLHFSLKNNDQYIFFADVNGNGFYDMNAEATEVCPRNSECISIWQIANGNFIKDFCINENCGSNKKIDSLDLVFVRPNPEPRIAGYIYGLGDSVLKGYSARLNIADSEGAERWIGVESTGRILID